MVVNRDTENITTTSYHTVQYFYKADCCFLEAITINTKKWSNSQSLFKSIYFKKVIFKDLSHI